MSCWALEISSAAVPCSSGIPCRAEGSTSSVSLLRVNSTARKEMDMKLKFLAALCHRVILPGTSPQQFKT